MVPLIYDSIIYHLESIGYELGRNFWIFSYDWRQSNEQSGKLFGKFVNERVENVANGVDVVCHSMGGIVARVAHKFYDVPIVRFVFLACPHFGTPQAYFAVHPDIARGYDVDFALRHLVGRRANRLLIKAMIIIIGFITRGLYFKDTATVMQGFQSIYELLPDCSYYLSTPSIVVAEEGFDGEIMSDVKRRQIVGPAATYCFGKGSKFSTKSSRKMAVDALRLKKSLGTEMPKSSLVIYSRSEDTPESIELYDIRWHMSGGGVTAIAGQSRGWRKPKRNKKTGDGVVADFSAVGGIENAIEVSGTHVGIVSNEDALNAIKEFLN